jgi:hypothetical protein
MPRRLTTRLAAGGLLAATHMMANFSDARAANAMSNAIEQAKPCKGLKISKLGVSIGVDEFKSADIERLSVEVDGDSAKISLKGSLACRTSDGALFRGDASAQLSAAFSFDLASCQFGQNSVQIVATGGSFGFAVEAAKHEIEHALESSISKMMRSLCK